MSATNSSFNRSASTSRVRMRSSARRIPTSLETTRIATTVVDHDRVRVDADAAQRLHQENDRRREQRGDEQPDPDPRDAELPVALSRLRRSRIDGWSAAAPQNT